MILNQETIDALKSMGINARWYPEQTFEEFQARMTEEKIKEDCEWYKGHGFVRELKPYYDSNIKFETVSEMEAYVKEKVGDSVDYKMRSTNYTDLFITYEAENATRTFIKKNCGKYCGVRLEDVLKWVEKDRKKYSGIYGRFTDAMNKLLKERGYDHCLSVYPTTYGIGVLLFYNWNAKNDVEKVESIMTEKGIEYYNEFSDARWVYRFKVSKKAENLARINA